MNNLSNTSPAYVFISEIPDNIEIEEVFCKKRDEEITKTANLTVKAEKYFVWRLLEYALSESYGIDITDVEFSKNENGRWTSSDFNFSLSHSDGVAAVAVSDTSVGIDIEPISTPRSDSFARRILSSLEYEEFLSIPSENREGYITKKWTQKEAVFKSQNLAKFIPRKTEPNKEGTLKTDFLLIKNKKYIYSVFTAEKRDVKVFVGGFKI